jgi:transposase
MPLVIDLLRMTSDWKKKYSLKGKMAEAMRYLRSQRHSLLTFLRDGQVPIDNNACERAIRPIAIGRNNWLFAGSEDGGDTAAILYTIVESARASGVDPQDYLLTLLRRIGTHPASQVSELTPWAMASELQPYRGHRSVV